VEWENFIITLRTSRKEERSIGQGIYGEEWKLMIDKISQTRLDDVHPDLKLVMLEAMKKADLDGVTIRVTCGVRDAAAQMLAFKSGASKLNGIPKKDGGTGVSEHQKGMAVDVVHMIGNNPSWSGASFKIITKYIKDAAKKKGISIVWGGDWPKFVDMPHFQLDRKQYLKDYIILQRDN
jgi:peptidoglycan L-alanyl-D-glutamate endopeptidase CwlK